MEEEKVIRLTSLKDEHKRRISLLNEFGLELGVCRLTSGTGLPCGMPPAFDIAAGEIVLLHEGFCGQKHKDSYESGEWKRLKFLQLMRVKLSLEEKLYKVNEELKQIGY